MIEKISIRGFKSLREVSLGLGPLNIFLGANATGKSNFFDALRIVQGVAFGLTIDEIFEGKLKTAGSEAWEAIRGGSAAAGFREWVEDRQQSAARDIALTIALPASSGAIEYSLGISADHGSVLSERLASGGAPVFDSAPLDNPADSPAIGVRYYRGKPGRQPHLHFEKSRPVLQQLARNRECTPEDAGLIRSCVESLGNMQRLDLSPAVLREYSRGPLAQRLGEHGENFAALVNSILADPSAASSYLRWLRESAPGEMDSVEILKGPLGAPLFALRLDQRTFAAPLLSDGTLRFAALAAALFQPDRPEVLMIEEIENGIHPTRLRLLVDLLKSQARRPAPQVMVTTHSPIVLSWLQEEEYGSVFFCSREERTGASLITPLSEIPAFQEIVRRQPIANLFAEGWMESAL